VSQPTRRLLYMVGTYASAAAIAPVLTELRHRLPDARHALAHASHATTGRELHGELGLPSPDYVLDVSPGSPVAQTTLAMERVERVIEVERPNLILLADDSSATLSAALTALKLYIPTARLNAGLRNFDRHTSEEINRVIMDTFADLLFADCEQAANNLRAEGATAERVHLVGSTTVDTLVGLEDRFRAAGTAQRLGLSEGGYLLVVLREATLADTVPLEQLLSGLGRLHTEMPVVLPAPARASDTWVSHLGRRGVRIVEPLDYLDLLALESTAACVITDSGLAQDETAYMGVPCLTLLEQTERVASLERGTNVAIGTKPPTPSRVRQAIEDARGLPQRRSAQWSAGAAVRLAEVVEARLSDIRPAVPPPLGLMLP
jgi:UDP-N-acetylglucosamine 2-epimerase (non-hydrolysing)